ncbi:MAG: TIGR02266 family protein, partial [Myxococcales bacterium]|nr:TIGR02266 family protein [Myxococcales bacterium]
MDPNTRQAKRTPVTLKIKFKSATLEEFIERYAVDVSHGGIFIRTKEPLAVGTTMKFEFQLKDASPLIGGEGTVVWTRENDPARPGVAPGMGVRFDRLADGSQAVLDKILAQKAKTGPKSSSTVDPKVFEQPTRAFGNEAPTKVAPSPLVTALTGAAAEKPRIGQMAPPKSGFQDERTDATPLPNPMPFHSDADEFPDEAFEEATKVRSLDELAAQTAKADNEIAATVAAAEKAKAAKAAADKAAADKAAADKAAADKAAADKAAADEAKAVDELAARRAAKPAKEAEPAKAKAEPAKKEPAKKEPEPAKAKAEPAKKEPAKKEPAKKEPEPAAAAVAPPADKPGSSIAILVAVLLLLGGAAAAYFLVFKKKDTAGEQPPTTTASGTTGTAGTGAATGSAGTGTASAGTGTGTAIAGTGTTPGTGTGSDVVPEVEMIEVKIAASVKGAQVEIVGTDQVGPAPFTAKIAKDQPATARVSAPGYVPQDVDLGADPVTVKLVPMPYVLHVTSDPPGANVYVEGAVTGKITPVDIELTAKQAASSRIRIQLRLAGYDRLDLVVQKHTFAESGDQLVADVGGTLKEVRKTVETPTGSGKGTGGGSSSGTTAGTGT